MRSVLLEILARTDIEAVIKKLEIREPFTAEDIATFAEMTIDFYADDTEFRIADSAIEIGWQFLKHLTDPTSGGKNRQQLVIRLQNTLKTLGTERASANKSADWGEKDQIDYKIDNFLQNTIEQYAAKIVGGYNKDVVKAFQRYREEQEDKKQRWRKDYEDRLARASAEAKRGNVDRDAGTQVHGQVKR